MLGVVSVTPVTVLPATSGKGVQNRTDGGLVSGRVRLALVAAAALAAPAGDDHKAINQVALQAHFVPAAVLMGPSPHGRPRLRENAPVDPIPVHHELGFGEPAATDGAIGCLQPG